MAITSSTSARAPGVSIDVTMREPAPAFETGVPAFLGFYPEDAPPETADGWRRLKDTYKSDVVRVDGPRWPTLEEELFGFSSESSFLGFALRGFFENGGRFCYLTIPAGGGFESMLGGLEVLDEDAVIDLVCAPDLARAAKVDADLLRRQDALIAFCERRGDCFAILDGIAGEGDDDLKQHRGALQGKPGADSAALYAPWIKVRGAQKDLVVPPSGHVAGVYARSDREVGMQSAPANEALAGVFDVERALGAAARGDLNENGINCLRALPGRGVLVGGARTLGGAGSLRFVSASRVCIAVRRWLTHTMAGLIFEPNDLRLWIRVSREVDGFLGDLFRRGALAGRTPEDAYFVKCDAETNTRALREAGRLVAEVGIAPSAPGELILIRVVVSRESAAGAKTPG